MKKLAVVFWASLVSAAVAVANSGSCQLSSVWVDRTWEIRDYQVGWKQHYPVLYDEEEGEISNANDFCVYFLNSLNRGDIQKVVGKEISWNTGLSFYKKPSRRSSLFRQDGGNHRHRMA